MRRGKYQTPKKRKSFVLWAALLLAVLSLSVGGVRAYLSRSAGPAENAFTVDSHPVIAVDSANKVTVSGTAYPVYLRAAVVLNWKSDSGNLLAAIPVEDTDYTLTAGTGWVKSGEFYYYTQAVNNGTVAAPVVTVTDTMGKNGCTLVCHVAVQAIQAVGSTDATPSVDAVVDAWGVQPTGLTAP